MPKCWRASSQIDNHIKNFPNRDPNQFSLRTADLIVQAAYYISGRVRMIILNKANRNAGGGHRLLVVAFEKKSALIGENIGLQNESVRKRCLDLLHGLDLERGLAQDSQQVRPIGIVSHRIALCLERFCIDIA